MVLSLRSSVTCQKEVKELFRDARGSIQVLGGQCGERTAARGTRVGRFSFGTVFVFLYSRGSEEDDPFVVHFSALTRKQVGEGNGTPLQYSCLENPMDGGAWKAAVHGVAKSWTRLSDFTFTFHFHALEKEMATHSSVLAWRIPGTGEPGGLPSLGSHRVGHD